jgi:hypothetical protein
MSRGVTERQMTSDAVLAGSTDTEAYANDAALWRERGDERQECHFVYRCWNKRTGTAFGTSKTLSVPVRSPRARGRSHAGSSIRSSGAQSGVGVLRFPRAFQTPGTRDLWLG